MHSALILPYPADLACLLSDIEREAYKYCNTTMHIYFMLMTLAYDTEGLQHFSAFINKRKCT